MLKFCTSIIALVAAAGLLAWLWQQSGYWSSGIGAASAASAIGLVAWTVKRNIQRRQRRRLEDMRDSALW